MEGDDTYGQRKERSRNKIWSRFHGGPSITLPGLSVRKGFLAQAKLIAPGEKISTSEYDRMKRQCDIMLDNTPDSFVFLYSTESIRIVPAIAIVSSQPINPHDLYSRGISRFYEDHFACFVGDRRLHAPDVRTLEAIADENRARNALALFAKATPA